MREGTKLLDGWHVFNLDETKHDAFEVLDRLMRAAGAKPAERDLVFERLMKQREIDADKARRAKRD